MDVRHRTQVYAELITDRRIDGDAWQVAHVQRDPVARCGCGGEAYTALGKPWEVHFRVRWYRMTCERCGDENEFTATRQFPEGPRLSRVVLEASAELERRRLAGA